MATTFCTASALSGAQTRSTWEQGSFWRKLTSKKRLSGWLERRMLSSRRSRIWTSELVTSACFIPLWRDLLSAKRKCCWNYLPTEQALVLSAITRGNCAQLAVRKSYFSCCGGHNEWGGYGINSLWQPYPGGEGRARIISQTNRKESKLYTHWI